MRKFIVGALLVASAIVMAGTVYAWGPMGNGPGSCGQQNCPNAGATTDQWQKFRTDSLSLREQLMTKKFELEKETLQPSPDKTKISGLEIEISTLKTTIQDLRAKAGLSDCKPSGKGYHNGIKGNCSNNMESCGQGLRRCSQ